MSESTTAASAAVADTSVPSTTPTTTATPAPAAAPAAAPAQAAPAEPSFIADRIARARIAALKELGLKVDKKSPDPIAEAKAKLESRKAERKELKAALASKDAQLAEATTAIATVKVYAEAQMAAMPEAQREAIRKVAGDDPAKQLSTISMLQLTGALPAFAQAPPAPPTPATTAPTGGAPAPSNAQGEDVRATYAQLKQTNPMAAAQYALIHQAQLLQR
jgi:hypothetical protein